MSLKENMQMVKEELSSEEKFFENAVKTERFVKKYKTQLIAGIATVVVFVAAMAVYDANIEAKTAAANKAFMVLQTNPEDQQAAAELEAISPELYDVWRLSKAITNKDLSVLKALSKSDAIAVADMAKYEVAVLNSDAALLEDYSYQQNAIYKDLALVELAVLLMEKGNAEAAHQKLQGVANDSPMYSVAQMLLHYGVK